MNRDFGRQGATTIERAYAGESLAKPQAALDEVENSITNAVSSAEVILCGLESLADRIFGPQPACETNACEVHTPESSLGRLHMLTDYLHDRLNRIDAVKNRLVELA